MFLYDDREHDGDADTARSRDASAGGMWKNDMFEELEKERLASETHNSETAAAKVEDAKVTDEAEVTDEAKDE
jgi:hypothetical protein